jgi:hypothetical protein
MNAHVGLTIDSGQAKFSALRHFIFLTRGDENPRLRRKCAGGMGLKRRFKFHPVGFSNGPMSESSIHRVDATGKGWLTFARFLQTEIGEQLDIAIGDIG